MKFVRHIDYTAFSSSFGRQMRWIVGPRQTGKTTLARHFLEKGSFGSLYYNWDNRQVRDAYIKNNHFFSSDIYDVKSGENGKRWICMDEIHKYPDWKNILKDFFDTFQEELQFIVTGSARLDMMRQSGDSLTGRYFSFRLNPVTLSEFCGVAAAVPPDSGNDLVRQRLDTPVYQKEAMEILLEYSGFPEPLSRESNRFQTRWQSTYLDTLIRDDLRELTQIKNMEKTAILMQLLPERIGSPLSINSLTRDLGCSFMTVANYLSALELGYLIFRISPYNRHIARSLKKERKVYFYDWTRAREPAKKFENFVAVELKSRINYWEDGGFGKFDLFYIRDRDGRETDFLIVRDSTPWLLLEAKLKRSSIDYHHKKRCCVLGNIPFIQLVREEHITEKDGPGLYQMSASRFFS